MDTYTMTHVQERLEAIQTSEPDTIRAVVANEALAYTAEDITSFFRDLLAHGCQCGMIGCLIYYRDTHAFFDTHYDEIEELRNEYQAMIGEPLPIGDNLKNWLAWFAFEETARKMVEELRLGI